MRRRKTVFNGEVWFNGLVSLDSLSKPKYLTECNLFGARLFPLVGTSLIHIQ